jgi:hypothetical protein
MISGWLSERLEISLHPYQLACLSLIVKVSYLILIFKYNFTLNLKIYIFNRK